MSVETSESLQARWTAPDGATARMCIHGEGLASVTSPPVWIGQYWAKARRTSGSPHAWHPLAWHSLDVAACVEALLHARPGLLASLIRALGGGLGSERDVAESARALAILLALAHDIGKFADGFQSQSPEACAAIGSSPALASSQGQWRHDNVGLLALIEDGIGSDLLPGVEPYDILPPLASASACHHGRPTDMEAITGSRGPSRLQGRSLSHAREFIGAASGLVGGTPLLPADPASACRASMILAGIINVADWLGSTFPYASPDHDLARYWRYARGAARRTVRRAGLAAAPARADASFAHLYPGKLPTPLQRVADTMALPDGPILVIVEEAAGGGKTEAAMTLAARMLASGKASGIYLALPTTATADAQAARQAEIASLLFADGGPPPTVMIAHSGTADGVLLDTDRERLAWLSDDRRRRLLADICVGTVDQALLAAMPAKFSAVRILGLVGKVLIIDEAHSYDDYTGTLLEALLEMHAALGGSAILLSATLPGATKAALAKAFSRGGFHSAVPAALPLPDAYPLVTIVPAGASTITKPAPAPRAPGDKAIAFVRSEAETEAAVLEAARAGLCVAWVRNTVDQAISSGLALHGVHGDVIILHSRFPEVERSRITTEVLTRFGRTSTSDERRGGILVATAVIEQSLDLDFDLVVVDLKPMEGIVQTLGRARRHSRDAFGNPLLDGAPDERAPRPMLILCPDHETGLDEAWYRNLLGNADFVHRDTGILWRTADALCRFGGVRYAEARRIVEEVRDPERFGISTPECFHGAAVHALGAGFGDRGTAKNAIREWSADRGYVFGGAPWDDELVPTRLGESVEVVLVRIAPDGAIRPYDGGAGWTSGRMRLRVSQAARLPCLDEALVPPGLSASCPGAKVVAVERSGKGDGFEVTRMAGLMWHAARNG